MSIRPFALGLLALGMTAIPAAAAAPGTVPGWAVDHAGSRLGFTGSLQGEDFDGQFTRWGADIQFDPANLAGSMAQVTVDMASGETGDPSRDDSLPGSDWFAADLFPQATFTTSSIETTGPGAYLAKGNLTIRGISQPASLPFTLAITGNTATMAGSLTIDRSSFGVGQGAYASANAVAYEVKVDVKITAKKAG